MLLNLCSASISLAFAALLVPPQQPPGPENARPALPPYVKEAGSGQAPAAPPTGPMRLEPFGIQDVRISVFGTPPERSQEPRARFLFKLTGERIGKVDRVGKLIVEELIDDTGKDLADPKAFTERERTSTNPLSAAANVAQNGYVPMDYTCASPPTRAAKKITKAKGYVNLVFGGPTEEVTIDNPMQYAGKTVENNRLKELGLTVRILKPGEESAEPADNRGIPIRIEAGEEMVKNIDLYDEWMKRMNVRPRVSKTQKDETYFFYQVMGGVVTPDCQLVLTVHKKIEREKVPFELTDLTLP
jgi:hypothetical protein